MSQEIKVDTKTILLGSFTFAIAFFIVGFICRHYVWIGA
jgi:hypothetical protein